MEPPTVNAVCVVYRQSLPITRTARMKPALQALLAIDAIIDTIHGLFIAIDSRDRPAVMDGFESAAVIV